MEPRRELRLIIDHHRWTCCRPWADACPRALLQLLAPLAGAPPARLHARPWTRPRCEGGPPRPRFKSEWWPDSFRNGGRLQIGIPAGSMSEHLAGLNRNPQARLRLCLSACLRGNLGEARAAAPHTAGDTGYCRLKSLLEPLGADCGPTHLSRATAHLSRANRRSFDLPSIIGALARPKALGTR